MRNTVLGVLVAAVCIGAAASSLRANETDQFTLPVGARFADLGPYFTRVHYRVLESAVETLNRRIDHVRWMSDEQQREAELRQLHSPTTVASEVRYQFLPGFIDTIAIENAVLSGAAQEVFPGELVSYKRFDWIYLMAHLPIDPRNVPLLFQSSTIKVYGSYMGTDKIAHFHDLGHIYFMNYQRKLRSGMPEEDARRWVADEFADGLISEGAIIGFIASGVFSNADLASNYVGMKFYQNLTEPVMLKGAVRPPMLVRVGDYWRLNHHVRPESDFFEPFVSDHFNEALNPSLYEWGLRRSIAGRIRRDAPKIVSFYAEGDGRPRDIGYFDALARELATYHGEDYGARGEVGKNLLSIGSTCLASLDGVEPPAASAAVATADSAADAPRSQRMPAWVAGVKLGSGPAIGGGQWVRGRRLLGPEMARGPEMGDGGVIERVVGGGGGGEVEVSGAVMRMTSEDEPEPDGPRFDR